MQVLQAGFGGSFTTLYGQALALLVGAPLDGCNTLSNAAQAGGAVLLLQAGNCSAAAKVGAVSCDALRSCMQ